MNPLVSVIIPTHNRSDKVVRALKSVLWQTYDNLEIIIIDDNSEDGTENIVNNFIKKFNFNNNIFFFRNDINRGNAETRNIGIKKAKGEYIAFLDDDDFWMPEKIEKQVELLLKNDGKAAFCGTIWMEGFKILKNTFTKSEKVSFENGGPTSTWLIHKSVFDEIGYLDEDFPSAVDAEFLVRLNRKFKLYFVNEYLYVHFYYNSQITSSGEKNTRGFEKMIEKHKKNFNNFELSSAYLKLAIYSLFSEKKERSYIDSLNFNGLKYALKSIRYKLNLQNLLLFILLLFPKKIAKIFVNIILDFLKYPYSFIGRYNKV